MARDFILKSRQKSLSGARNSWRNIYSGAQPAGGRPLSLSLCCRGKIKFREKSAVIFPSQIYLPLFKRDENKRQLFARCGVARRGTTQQRSACVARSRRDGDKHERAIPAHWLVAFWPINQNAHIFNSRDFLHAPTAPSLI